VNAQRLKALRLARGFTLEELSENMGGLVTKQALSKYERGLSTPSPAVLVQLARALKVKAIEIATEPVAQIEVLGFRKRAALSKAREEQIVSEVCVELDRRTLLQERVGIEAGGDLPVRRRPVGAVAEAEDAAEELRSGWHLGLDPIASVTDMLEDHRVHVIEVEAPEALDGVSAVASVSGAPVAAAVVSRRGVSGERQRLNLAHELGHLFLRMPDGIDQEKTAFRFGAALLAPRRAILSEVGSRRTDIREDELLLLKRRYGMSMQALVYRLHDLHIISDRHYADWWKYINAMGWKKTEPEEIAPETPLWMRQTTLRALSEGLVTLNEAEDILGCRLEPAGPVPRRQAIAHLAPGARKSMPEKQAKSAADHYADESDAAEDDPVVEY
jgi:transcriptional regulator with XRE-family HTH domain